MSRGHTGNKPSVANAATLFGSESDSDPFASISGGNGLDVLGEEEPTQHHSQSWNQQYNYSAGQQQHVEDHHQYDYTRPHGYDPQQQDCYGQQQQQYGQYDPQLQQQQQYDQTQYDPQQQQQYDQYNPQQQPQYNQSQYDPQQSQYHPSQYGQHQQQYDSQQYDQIQYGQYDQSQYGQQGQYDQQQQYNQGQYDQGQYGQQPEYDNQSHYDPQTHYDGQSQYDSQNSQQQYDQGYDHSQQHYSQGYDQTQQQYSQGYDPSQQQYSQGYDYSQQQYSQGYDDNQQQHSSGYDSSQQQQYSQGYDPASQDQNGASSSTADLASDSLPPRPSSSASAPTYDPQTASIYQPSVHSEPATADNDNNSYSSNQYQQYSPSPQATSLQPAASPIPAPAKTPPPPKGPARRSVSPAQQPTAAASAPPPPAAPQSAVSDSAPAPWDLPLEEPSHPEEGAESKPISLPHLSSSSATSPVLRRQPTPRLTITDESGQEAHPAGLESGSESGHEGADDDLDEATRDFNDLQLGLGKKARRDQGHKSDPWFSSEEQSENGAVDDNAETGVGEEPLPDTESSVAEPESDPWFGEDEEGGQPASIAPNADPEDATAEPIADNNQQQRYRHAHQVSSISQADDAWFADDQQDLQVDENSNDPDATIAASTSMFGEYEDEEQNQAEGVEASQQHAAADVEDSQGEADSNQQQEDLDPENASAGYLPHESTASTQVDNAFASEQYTESYAAYEDKNDAQSSYDPYAPPTQVDQQSQSAGGYDPYAPAPAQESSAYDAYAPAATQESGAQDPYAPAATQESGAQDPYAPAATQENGAYDPYAPAQSQSQNSGAYDSYAPVQNQDNAAHDPYAPVTSETSHAQDSSAPSDAHQEQGAVSSDAYNPYAPSYSAPDTSLDGQSAYNPYLPSESNTTTSAEAGPGYSSENYEEGGQYGYDAGSTDVDATIKDPYGYNPSGPPTGEETYEPEGNAQHGGYGHSSKPSVYDPYAPQEYGQSSGYAPQQQSYDPYAPAPAEQSQSREVQSDAYAPNERRGSLGYGADAGWSGSTSESAYGPSHQNGIEDPMENMDTPIAPHPPHSLGAPFGAGGPPLNGNLNRAKTITQRSYSQQGFAGQSEYAPAGGAGDYFNRPGSAAGSQAGLASPYDPASFPPTTRDADGGSQLYSGQASDPIEERRGAKIPVVSFGLDGKIAAFFPLQSTSGEDALAGGTASNTNPYAGFGVGGSDVSLPTKIVVHNLSSLVSPTSFASSFDPLTFPGPAFEGAPNASGAIARATGTTGVSAAVKTKKATLIKYLRDAADEMNAGMGYRKRRPSFAAGAEGDNALPGSALLQGGDQSDAQKTEDRILLLHLLALVLEHDGNTSNNAAFDEGVRQLLTSDGEGKLGSSTTFSPANMPAASTVDETPLVTNAVTAGSLKQIQEYLMTGQRKEAVEFAAREKLWAHAMVIASAVDQATWRQVAQDFAQSEVLVALQQQTSSNGPGLKMMYDIFSGQDPRSIYHLFQPAGGSSNNEGVPADPAHNWKQSAAMIIANRCAGDSAALTAMGDGLATQGWQEAAHVCYLLSPQTSPLGGADGGHVRLTLLGAHNPLASASYRYDLDHMILSEIYEFSHALQPVVKGQESFPGLAYLQAYRLVHAYRLAELGDTKGAQKYCEAIASVMKSSKNSPYFHRVLVAQLKELSDRLVGGPQLDSGGNWVTRKMQRPTLDGMLSAFEGRFTKFIAGDDANGDSSATSTPSRRGGNASSSSTPTGNGGIGSGGGAANGGGVGAFSHYSAITPDAGSAAISRVQSYADFSGGQSVSSSRPSSRAASAMGYQSQQRQQQQRAQMPPRHFSATAASDNNYNRGPSSSASSHGSDWESGYGAGNATAPYAAGGGFSGDSAYQPSSSSSQTASETDMYGSNVYSYGQTDQTPWPGSGEGTEGERHEAEQGGGEEEDTTYRADTPSWGYDANSAGPQDGFRPQFFSTAEQGGAAGDDPEGFLSPMDTFSPAPMPTFDHNSVGGGDSVNDVGADEDEDDLGFGNFAHKPEKNDAGRDEQGAGKRDPPQQAPPQQQGAQGHASSASGDSSSSSKQPELKPSPSTSWLGRLWGRRDSSDSGSTAESKAKQAHMGEQSSFYYDKDLKKWVNKKAGDSGASTPTPPPPPRATTASPSMASRSVSGPSPGRSPTGGGGPPQSMMNRSSTEGYRSASASATGTFSSPNNFRSTPPISEDSPLETPGSGGGLTRIRSNLGDPNQPVAVQPPMRPGSATGSGPMAMGMGMSAPPPSRNGPSSTGGNKKKPISKRYVRVD
ncbi:unnamed protein product [Sympodiomycopsis kandeliae]